jgi:Family of unknown function (DUF5522)
MADESLVPGIDYYIENGRWVFTAHYLQKRGYCCESGCRHCPYGFRKTAGDVKENEPPSET